MHCDQRTKTKLVNLRHAPYTVYIGRAGKGQSGTFGNPFARGFTFEGLDAIQLYTFYFAGRIQLDDEFKKKVDALEGETLGCFCVDKDGNGDCHGQVILNYLNLRAKGELS